VRARLVVAIATGWCYRLADRVGMSTRASRQEVSQRARTAPDTPRVVSAGPGTGGPVRVLLLGNGPAESHGVVAGTAGFPTMLATALAMRLDRRVEVRTVLGAAWQSPELSRILRDEDAGTQHALVVSAAYRPELAQIPLGRWKGYAEGLRTMLVEAAGPETAIRVLALPWRQAARDSPVQWGGLFGNRVIVTAAVAESTIVTDPRVRLLRLRSPLVKREWVGPAFSAQTYGAWADQVAADLATTLGR
jgi:hypothetical protein